MLKMHTANGWATFIELAAGLPYTIVVGRGASARKSVRDFHTDDEAIRWARMTLADQGDRVRLYRGHAARGKPLMEISS